MNKKMDEEFQGRVALITGGGTGIGRAIAEDFAQAGFQVAICGRREEKLKETTEAIRAAGGTCFPIRADISDPKSVKALVDQCLQHFGQIDVLYNNAGSFTSIGGIWEVDVEEWWKDVTINLRGPMLTMNAVLPHMMKRNSGIIINMNGGGSTEALPGGSGYGSSKTALLRLTESTARELERQGYSGVYAVCMGPGTVHTEMTQYQVDTEMGRKWIPSTAECIVTGEDMLEPTICANNSLNLIRCMRPSFNGRNFGATTRLEDVSKTLDENPSGSSRLLRMA